MRSCTSRLKIGAGRDDAVKRKVCDALFEMVKAHFAALYARRYLALSMELVEFSEGGTVQHNNVHAKFKKRLCECVKGQVQRREGKRAQGDAT